MKEIDLRLSNTKNEQPIDSGLLIFSTLPWVYDGISVYPHPGGLQECISTT